MTGISKSEYLTVSRERQHIFKPHSQKHSARIMRTGKYLYFILKHKWRLQKQHIDKRWEGIGTMKLVRIYTQ
jgi:hypothetical protein